MAREQEKLDELDRRQLAVDQRLKSASRHESRRTAMEIATGVTKPIGGSGAPQKMHAKVERQYDRAAQRDRAAGRAKG